VSTHPSDAALQRSVQRLLGGHPALSGQQITVTVRGGVVFLRGAVDRTSYARAARQGARSVAGVRSVVDELELRPCGAGRAAW